MTVEEQHHRYSASGAEGWMNCPGKIAMEQGMQDSYSAYADQGTAAHFLAGESLTNKVDAEFYKGKTIICYMLNGRSEQLFTDGSAGIELPEGAVFSSEWPVDFEMVDYVQRYIDRVLDDAGDGALLVEQRVEFGDAIGLPGAFGTGDAVVISNDGKRIIIRDLKYGYKPVSAFENKQMQLYALGFLHSFDCLIDPELVEEIDLGIIQPRTNSPDLPWTTTIPGLYAFAEEAKQAIAKAEGALVIASKVDMLVDSSWQDKYLSPSEKGCQWCKAKAKCPALAKESINDMLVGVPSTDGLDDLDACTDMEAIMEAALQSIPGLDFETVTKLYQVKDKIKIWIDAIDDRMMHDMLLGHKTPLYKLVKGREGNRKWKSEVEAESLMKRGIRLKQDEMYDKKIISPATAEKLLAKKSPKKWARIKDQITRSEAKLTVAPMDDERESFDPYGEQLALLPDLSDLSVNDLL